jgi:DNA polymerase I-like protein with 3'-5' exonuclease and polymerase domains
MTLDLTRTIVLDFETMPIEPRPAPPPLPVGLAVRWPKCWHDRKLRGKSQYVAWGHVGHKNPHTLADGVRVLREAWESGLDLLFHNSKFDVVEALERMGMEWPGWERIHDTMFMLFLKNPRLHTFGLKPNAEVLLGEAPEERNAMIAWLVAHQPVPGIKLVASRPKAKQDVTTYAGAYVAYAPPSLAGPYACGDVDRTYGIAKVVYPEIVERRMVEAYDRERRLLPHIIEMEKQGIRVDQKRLQVDCDVYDDVLESVDAWIWNRLGRCFNIDSGDQLVAAMVAAKVADPKLLGLTKQRKVQTNKEAIERGVPDEQFRAVLTYRGKLCTCLRTFMHPWLATAKKSGGLVFAQWYTTRTDKNGARTGRMSSSPNLQNLAKLFEAIFLHQEHLDHWSADLAEAPLEGLPDLPNIRTYVVPYTPGDVLIDRDYSQQELRIFAHYEGGDLLDQYLADNWLDVHEFIRKVVNDLLKLTGTKDAILRKAIKTMVFGIIYGMGLLKLSKRMDCTEQMARKIKAAVMQAADGIREVMALIKQRAAEHKPIRTWGGREYFCEEAHIVDGKMRDFAYRLFNILIQGSAADCTKEAVIRYGEAKLKRHRMLIIAHDEILASVPWGDVKRAMETMRKAMESIVFKVPMLSEGKWSTENWGALFPYDKKGKFVAELRAPRRVIQPMKKAA